MDTNTSFIEPLFERAEAYGKTSFELLRLKALNKTADVSSTLFSRSLFILVISIFAFTINIAIALWLGDLLGKSYYGFLIVSGFYAIVAVVLLIAHPTIKKRAGDTIVKQLFN